MVPGVAFMIRFLVVLALFVAGGTVYLKKTQGIGLGEWIFSQVARNFGKKTGVDTLVTGGETRKITALLYASKPQLNAILQTSVVIPACKTFFEKLAALELNGHDETGGPHYLFVKDLPRVGADCELTDPDLKWASQNYFESCFASNPSTLAAPDARCFRSLVWIRAAVTRHFLSEPSKLDSLEKEELADLLLASVFVPKGRGAIPAYGEIREVAERLDKKHPSMPLIQKVLFVARANLWKVYRESLTYPEQAKFWEDMKGIHLRGRDLGLPPGDLKNMELVLETRGFEPSQIKKLVDSLAGSPENAAKRSLLTAFYHWKQAEAAAALEQIEAAIRTQPGEKIFPALFKELSVSGAGEEVFMRALNVDLDPTDFENRPAL